jgi:hypothetical protein
MNRTGMHSITASGDLSFGTIHAIDRRTISEIHIGTRHRGDLGDFDGLTASIREVRLLHPVVITPQRELISEEAE